MDEETRYPVCPHRNSTAAFECFLGPDSRGIDRFCMPGRIARAAEALQVMQLGAQVVSLATSYAAAGIAAAAKEVLLRILEIRLAVRQHHHKLQLADVTVLS